MELALNNVQMLICHKTQTTNQPTELWRIRITYSLQSVPGPILLGEEAPDRVLGMSQIELFDN